MDAAADLSSAGPSGLTKAREHRYTETGNKGKEDLT
jgi:hypothetical protein